MTRLCAWLGVVALAGSVLAAQGASFRRAGGDARNVMLTAPRIAPVPASQWTDAQRAVAATYGSSGNSDNQLATLLNHPEMAAALLPVVKYFSEESELSPRQRETLILRTAWLSGSEYIWAHHAVAARRLGFSQEDLQRIADGPLAGPSPEFFLIVAADELHGNSAMSDATWKALSNQLNQHQLMDATFTVPAFTLLAIVDKSLGVQLESGITERLPGAARISPVAPGPNHDERPAAARIAPLEQSDWTPEIRKMLDPTGSGRNPIAVYRTFARHPKLYAPRQLLSEHIRLQNTLSARVREMLILRMGWIGQSEYEWQQHARTGRAAGLDTERVARGPDAPDWDPLDRALLRAADEMYRNDMVSDATWNALKPHFDTKQMMDVLVTAGGYRMVSTVLNAFGVQLEPGNERFPAVPWSW